MDGVGRSKVSGNGYWNGDCQYRDTGDEIDDDTMDKKDKRVWNQ